MAQDKILIRKSQLGKRDQKLAKEDWPGYCGSFLISVFLELHFPSQIAQFYRGMLAQFQPIFERALDQALLGLCTFQQVNQV